MSPASKPIDTLVVGAGWAGLMSALNLTQAGKSVLVLEARPRIGGRAFTHTWRENTLQDTQRTLKAGEKGFATDFGCSYIHGYNEGNPAREIAKRFGVPTFVPKPTQTRIVGPNGILPSSLSQRLQANLQAAQDFAKSKARSLRSNESTSSTPEVTLSSVLIDDEKSPLYADLNTAEDRTLAASYARSMHIPLGTEMEHVSLQHFGSENNYGGTDAVPQGGFTVLIDKIADQIGRGNIKLGAEASKIKYDRGTSSVHVTTRSQDSGEEETHVARNAIVTVPLAVLRKMQGSFDPPLDGRRVDAMERVTVGNLNKVLLAYDHPWWSDDVGTFFVLPESPKSKQGASLNSLDDIFNSATMIVSSLCAPNGSSEDTRAPALLAMIGASAGKALEGFERVEVAQALHTYLSKRLKPDGNSADVPVRHTFYSRWARQEHTGGATTTPVTLGNSPKDFSTLASSDYDGHLHFAGEHCEPDHRGSIAGAIVSAQTASDAVLRQLSASSHI